MIEQFSTKDAENYDKYNNEMEKLADAITFMIDAAPIENSSSFREKLNTFRQMHNLFLFEKVLTEEKLLRMP